MNKDKLSFLETQTQALKNKQPREFVILFKGNSITRHAFDRKTIANLGWDRECGMAASSEEKDYAHLLANKIQSFLPHKKIRLVFGRGGRPDQAISSIGEERLHGPDLIVVQDGEHSAYSPWGEHFSADYEKLLLSLKEFPDNPVIITIGIWNPRCRKEFIDCTSPDYDSWAQKINSIQEEISSRLGILFASVSAFENDPLNTGDGKVAGVRWHPNDNGMVKYADAAFEKFRQYFKT